jgi:two-component system OmpR family response regulator
MVLSDVGNNTNRFEGPDKLKILVIEDDRQTVDFITKGLKQENFTVQHCYDGEEGYYFASTECYDVIIVDIMLPKLDGLALIHRLRQHHISTPVIVLSAKGSLEDRIRGLQTGGDDYMVKPFAFSELVARIQALTRRMATPETSTTLQIDQLVLDVFRHRVFWKGEEIVLQPKELSLLEYLLRNQGRVVSKTMIMEHVWDYNFDPQTNVVESKISKLRTKLMDITGQAWIHTIRGLGYILDERH